MSREKIALNAEETAHRRGSIPRPVVVEARDPSRPSQTNAGPPLTAIRPMPDGRYFRAADLGDAEGASAGTVFLYEGKPSWMFVVVRHAPHPGPYDVVVTAGSSRMVVATCHADGETCSAGATIDVAVSTISDVRLVALDGTTLDADLRER